jgi:hypothetical protein
MYIKAGKNQQARKGSRMPFIFQYLRASADAGITKEEGILKDKHQKRLPVKNDHSCPRIESHHPLPGKALIAPQRFPGEFCLGY